MSAVKTKARKGKQVKAGPSLQTYATPWSHVRAIELDSFGGRPFDLDVAADASNAKAPAWYDAHGNGLRSLWAAPQVFCNPTYENQGDWLARAVWHAREYGVSTASLVLASTSANYWRPCAFEAGVVDFYEGRIAFLGGDGEPVRGFDRASALVLVGPAFRPGVVRIRDALTGHLVTRLPHGVQPSML